MKKILLILLGLLTIEIIISCCDCIEPTSHNYTHSKIKITHLDNSGAEAFETTSDSIIKTAYGIRFRIFSEEVVMNFRPVSLFVNNALATSCNCPPERNFIAKDSIISFKIYTIFEFSDQYKANSDITSLFRAIIDQGKAITSIEEYLSIRSGKFGLVAEEDTNDQTYKGVDLLLMTFPEKGVKHQFRIELELSDGRILKEDTSPIFLI